MKLDELIAGLRGENEGETAVNAYALEAARRLEDVRVNTKRMKVDHVVSGSPGPLYGAGWAAACKFWADELKEKLND